MYYDLFVFPWLKYRVDAPGYGNDFLIRTFFQPDKKWYVSSDYKQEKKPGNQEIAEIDHSSCVFTGKKALGAGNGV